MLRTALLIIFVLASNISLAQLSIGQTPPDIKLPDSLGKWTKLSEVKADIIIVDFWASWCRNCHIVVKELKKIKEKYPNHSLAIFAVSLDRDYRKWINMVNKYALPFIHVNDAYGLKSPRCKDYEVEHIPQKFLIVDGKLQAINPSFFEIEKELDKKE